MNGFIDIKPTVLCSFGVNGALSAYSWAPVVDVRPENVQWSLITGFADGNITAQKLSNQASIAAAGVLVLPSRPRKLSVLVDNNETGAVDETLFGIVVRGLADASSLVIAAIHRTPAGVKTLEFVDETGAVIGATSTINLGTTDLAVEQALVVMDNGTDIVASYAGYTVRCTITSQAYTPGLCGLCFFLASSTANKQTFDNFRVQL